MSHVRASHKFVLAALALAASVASAQPASAQYGYPGYSAPAPSYRPPPPPRYYAPPEHCYMRRVWVPGPYGPHPVMRRYCR
jgi:hypothetical protein